MSYFISTTADFKTGVKNPESNRYYKITVNSVDVTEYLIPGTVSGKISDDSISDKWSFQLRNVSLGKTEGDNAGDDCIIQATVNDESYITLFTGRISEKGATRAEGYLSDDVVKFEAESGLTDAGTRRIMDAAALANYKISDPANTSASIIHYIAEAMGQSSIDVNEIDHTKDFVIYRGKEKPWSELQSIQKQFIGELYFNPSNVLTFRSIFDTGYSAPTSEWTFSNDPDDDASPIHSIQGYNTPIKGNRVSTEFEEYEQQTIGDPVFTLTDNYNKTTGEISVVVPAGEYYPGPSAGDVLACDYAKNGEKLAFATSIITPTIGTGSTNDIVCSGGVLTLTSFNGSTSATKDRPDAAEIILYNATGGDITITRFQIRGTGYFLRKKNKIISTGNNVISNDWEYKDVTLPGRYACSDTQANTSTTWVARKWENERKRWQIETAWLPNARPRAVVTLIKPDDSTEYTCRIISVQHSGSTGKPNSYLRTVLLLEENFSTTVSTTPRVQVTDEQPRVAQSFENVPTYQELQEGYTAGGGTVSPSAPTLVAYPFFKSIALSWNAQNNLTNLDYYEVQVSADDATWYALKFDGTDWKGTLGATTQVYTNYVTHSNIPFGGTEADPTGVTLYYRVRATTKDSTSSSWSSSISATTSPTDTGDIAASAITADKITTAVLNTLVANINSYLEISADAGWVSRNYLSFAQPGDRRTWQDQDEFRIQRFGQTEWEDRIKLGSIIDEGDDNMYIAGTQYKPDGLTNWGSNISISPISAGSLAYTDGKLIVTSSTNILLSQDNGATWSSETNPLTSTYQGKAALGYGGIFLVGTTYGKIARSTDGENWSSLIDTDLSGIGGITGMAYGNGVVVATGATGSFSNGLIYSTDDGLTWSSVVTTPFTSTSSIFDVAFGDNTFLAVGSNGEIARSTDNGQTWGSLISNNHGTSAIYTVEFYDGIFVAAGADGKLSISTNAGVTWSALKTSQFGTTRITSICNIYNFFIAVGYAGKSSYSEDGDTWISLSTNFSTTNIENIVAGNKYAIATGGSNIEKIELKLIPYNSINPQPFDISSANQSYTLPAADSDAYPMRLSWSGGDGTYELTVTGKINDYSAWTGKGEGSLTIYSDGTSLYTEGEGVFDTVLTANQTSRFYINGTQVVKGTYTNIDLSSGSPINNNIGAYGWSFYAKQFTVTFDYAFNSVKHYTASGYPGAIQPRVPSTSSIGVIAYSQSTAQDAGFNYTVEVEGRWRA